ncbi:hypothetical protein CBR_g52689 [Chara braunii]|uniref:Reverse transcriptase domain-containing protein n=1 Tax=Chara braunii TaxID=69332 RepID=A0A388MAX8_CHABU|nr:hypothetical protein CBR_g52689 [Chara braunii]|eukprot:GBG91653.1 hypothetical protein CBR_g52689 [Chara braunii]
MSASTCPRVLTWTCRHPHRRAYAARRQKGLLEVVGVRVTAGVGVGLGRADHGVSREKEKAIGGGVASTSAWGLTTSSSSSSSARSSSWANGGLMQSAARDEQQRWRWGWGVEQLGDVGCQRTRTGSRRRRRRSGGEEGKGFSLTTARMRTGKAGRGGKRRVAADVDKPVPDGFDQEMWLWALEKGRQSREDFLLWMEKEGEGRGAGEGKGKGEGAGPGLDDDGPFSQQRTDEGYGAAEVAVAPRIVGIESKEERGGRERGREGEEYGDDDDEGMRGSYDDGDGNGYGDEEEDDHLWEEVEDGVWVEAWDRLARGLFPNGEKREDDASSQQQPSAVRGRPRFNDLEEGSSSTTDEERESRFRPNIEGREVFEERAYLIGIEQKNNGKQEWLEWSIEESLSELTQLAETAGLHVVGSTYQRLERASPRTYIGSGKVSEIKAAITAFDVETVIFDDELSPGQLRNLEKALGEDVRVCDRTALILDIFSQRAATREGKLQVPHQPELMSVEQDTGALPRRSARLAVRTRPAVPPRSKYQQQRLSKWTTQAASSTALTVPVLTGVLPACPVQGAQEPLADYLGRLQVFTDAVAAAKVQQEAAEAERQRLANEAAAQAQQTAEADAAARDRRNAASTESMIQHEKQWTTLLEGMFFVPTEAQAAPTQAAPTQAEGERSNLATLMLSVMRGVMWNNKLLQAHLLAERQQRQKYQQESVSQLYEPSLYGPRVRRKTQPTQVTLADGRTQKSIDRCVDDVPVYFAPLACEPVFFDILDTKFDMILGMSWLRSADHPVNFHDRTVHIRDRNGVLVPCTVATPHTSIACHVVSVARIRDAIARNDIEEMALVFLHALPSPDGPAASPPDPRISYLLDEYRDVFEAPTGTVPDRPIRHGITLEAGAVPSRGCIYRMSEEELEVLRAQLDDLLDKGWIRPSCSPYGASVLFVWKKNKDLRLCIDYRKLNAQTVKNVGPLPRIDDLLERLGGATYFSKVDLKSGYHQIEIQPQDRYKTAIKTRYGHFEWVVMPFGLTNAPATFQATMTTEFRDLRDRSVLIYLDDILAYRRTLDEHIVHLRVVLDRLRLAKYKANLDKCEFAKQELEYLGHFVTPKGIRPLADKIQAIVDWPEPRCTTDVRSFMGLAGYYQRFVESYSKVAAPLSRLQSPKLTERLGLLKCMVLVCQMLKQLLF